MELEKETPKGRRALSQDEVAKLEKAISVYKERPSDFSVRKLAEVHGVGYQNLLNRLKKQGLLETKARVAEKSPSYRFEPKEKEQPLLYPHSIVTLKFTQLEELLTQALKYGVRGACETMVKEGRISVLNPTI